MLKNLPEGTEARVACPQDYPYYDRYRGLLGDANIFALPHRQFSLAALWSLRAFCRARGVAVLHSHGKGAGVYSRLLAVLTGLPCLHTFHGVHMREYGLLKKAAYRLYEQCMARFTTAGIAVSEGERGQILRERLMPERKLRLIPNGVEIPETAAGEAAGPPFAVVSLSRFDYQKNSLFLVEILEALRDRGRLRDFRIVAVGDGEDRATALAAANDRGLAAGLECAGSSPAPHAFFANALCYLSTSRWEGMPLAVLEAMAHGLSAVVTDVVGNRDAVRDGETGFVYAEGEAKAAADALCRLADEPDLRRSMAGLARDYARRQYDVRMMAEATYALLRDAASRKS